MDAAADAAAADAAAEDAAVDVVLPNRLLGVLYDDEAADDDTVPKRLRGDVTAAVVAVGASAAVDDVVDVLDGREKRFLSSSVEKAAPVLRTGDECVDDSADVLLSELRAKRSMDRRPTRDVRVPLPVPSTSSTSELPDDVREYRPPPERREVGDVGSASF